MKNLTYPLFVSEKTAREKVFEHLKTRFAKYGFDALEVQSPELGPKLVITKIAFDYVNEKESLFVDSEDLSDYMLDLDMEFVKHAIDDFEKEHEDSKIRTISFYFPKGLDEKFYFA